MKNSRILKEIKSLEQDYKILNKEFKNLNILKSEKNTYIKEDKESFKIFWLKYIDFFTKLKKLIKFSKYRSFYFFVDYNKIILRKYILVFYFNSILNLEKEFGKHGGFIRMFLGENFKKDYAYFAKYIYRPSFINLINTPNIFIKAFYKFINPNIYKLLNSKKLDIKYNNRLKTGKNNLYFFIKYRLDKILFFLSKNIGYIISKTRFTNRTKSLITIKNLNKYLDIAKPGDILLTRGNWNASNLSIPGFWKHMSMYIGKGKYLKKNFPYKFTDKLKDNSHYIIEASLNGTNVVAINNLISSSDYLGVSRAKFTSEKINRVLNNSFKNIGKGYDHRFDYFSDNNLVCSELIIKAYAKEFIGDVGIEIKLEDIGISLTYPPNNFVDLLSKGDQNIEPIFFIDSIEKTGENFISTNDEFIKSRKRSRSTLFLK